MKTITILVVGIFIMASLCCISACTPLSSRKTPTVRVVKNYAPIVVNIRTETIVDLKDTPEWGLYGNQLDNFFKQYFGEDYSEGILKHKSIGSGVIVSKKGHIVTNAHVIQKANSVFAVLMDGTILKANVLAADQENDLAIIKTDLPYPVRAVKFADIKDLMVGETVIAIGNPFGFENSVTVGVISGKERTFSNQKCEYACSGLLQTDASINPGNSGGALLNLDGELVGINLAVIQNAQNVGFAVPVDKIMKMLVKLNTKGE